MLKYVESKDFFSEETRYANQMIYKYSRMIHLIQKFEEDFPKTSEKFMCTFWNYITDTDLSYSEILKNIFPDPPE